MHVTAEPTRVLWLIERLGPAERLLAGALLYLDREAFDYQVGYFLPWKDATRQMSGVRE